MMFRKGKTLICGKSNVCWWGGGGVVGRIVLKALITVVCGFVMVLWVGKGINVTDLWEKIDKVLKLFIPLF